MKIQRVALTLALGLTGCSKHADSPHTAEPSPPEPLKNPITTQIDEGARLYGQHCASCHGNSGEGASAPMLVGAGALPQQPPADREHRTGEFTNVQDVFEFVRATMPPGDPGALTEDQVWSILAFDLSANGIELEAPLTPAAASTLTLR